MMKIFVVLAVLIHTASAQVLLDTLPTTSPICTTPGVEYRVVDKSAFYTSAFTGVTSLCVKNYLDTCATPRGLEVCNRETSRCTTVGYSWDDAIQYPTVAPIMAQRPEFCTSSLTARSSSTSVILIAQIILSAVILISAFIVFVVLVKCSAFIKGLLGLYLALCFLLLFSYYYLNAIVIYVTVLAAAACLGFRTDRGFALCCAFLLLGFFWVTYSFGLGYAQHHSRLQAASASFNYQSSLCDNYYDGFFAWPLDAHGDNDNLLVRYRGICHPEWVSAELFFMILVEQLIIPFIAIAAWVHFRDRKDHTNNIVATN